MATPTTLPSSFTAGQVLTAAQMNNLRGAFRVLTVNSVTKTDTFSTTSTSFVDVTGLSLTITPQSSTSKFLLVAQISAGANADKVWFKFAGGNTASDVGDTAGSRIRVGLEISAALAAAASSGIMLYLDSPATASATRYSSVIS